MSNEPWQFWTYPREPQVIRNAEMLMDMNASLILELRQRNVSMPVSAADLLHRAEGAGWLLREELERIAVENRDWRALTRQMIERGDCP